MATMLGLEIRKINKIDFNSLYRDVDTVLQKANITKLSVGNDIKKQTLLHGMNKMFQPSGFLDICDIRKWSEMLGVCIQKERVEIYSSLHCIHWNDMEEDYRKNIIAMIFDDFRAVLNPEEINAIIINN